MNSGETAFQAFAKVCALLLLSRLSPAWASAQTVFSISPSSGTDTVGQNFMLDVNVSGASDLYGYQFDLAFNPAVVSASGPPTEGDFLSRGGATYFIPGTIDNAGGTVIANADTLLTAMPGVTGSGTLASFDFTAIDTGTSSFAIENVTALNSNLNPITTSAVGGSITVTSKTVAAPELDPSSCVTAFTLLGGLAVLLRGRRNRLARAVKQAGSSDPT